VPRIGHYSGALFLTAFEAKGVADQITIVLFAKLFIERFGNIRASFPNSRRTILAARQI
jgi:hypothetical protein